MERIRESFLQIEDTRHASYVEHNLANVLISVLSCVNCAITELADMMVYFASKKAFCKEHFGIENHLSKPTLSCILNMVDGDAVGRVYHMGVPENSNKTQKVV